MRPRVIARLAAASVGLVLGLSLTSPPRAHAFSDPISYTDPTSLGGGAGRFFTGSRADGYACNSCHTGGAPVALQVTGLPVGGYVPGGSYEIFVRWPLGLEHLGMVAEVTGPDKRAAGTLVLPRFDAMQEGERCTLERGGGAPAAEIIDNTVADNVGERQFVGVIDCGATYTRMLWTAPIAPLAGVRFNLGFVAADNDGDAAGDGVTLIDQPLSSGSDEATEVVQGCSAAGAMPGSSSRAPLWVGLFAPMLIPIIGRRARQKVET